MPLSPPIPATTVTDLLSRIPRSSFVGGSFLGGTPSLEVTNPATGEVLTQVVDADAPAVATSALDAAAAVQASWAATTPRERSEILRRAFDLVHERADDLAVLMTLEMGKPLAEAYGEVAYGAEFFRWFSEEAVRAPGHAAPAVAAAGQDVLAISQPVGPCLAITPWNFPLSMGTRKIGPALAAGCTIVLKPASATPLTSLLLMEILRDAGVPDGVVSCVVTSDSRGLSETLLADPRLRKLSFTGSTSVGKGLMRLAADRVLRTSMELGGNAPFLVLPCADMDTAVTALMAGKFRNNGEACTAVNRVLVHRDVADEFSSAVVERVRSTVRLGDGLAEGTTLGPLIAPDAVAFCQELVDDAVSRGATAVLGAALPADGVEGSFYPATVLTGVPRDARVQREEIFGPVLPITVCDSVEEMIEAANDTEFGLISYVAGEHQGCLRTVVGALEAGMVAVNVGVASDPAMPFGGVKESGIGREGSHVGLQEYLETKYIRIG